MPPTTRFLLTARAYGGGYWHTGALIQHPPINGLRAGVELEHALRALQPGRIAIMRCEPVLILDLAADGPTRERLAAVERAIASELR